MPPFILLLGQNHIAEILIVNGARVNAKTFDDWTPLHFAAERSNLYIKLYHFLLADLKLFLC